ncbi:MAG: hypothetical protein IJ498_08775 [Akkermansia sp.]|nr:hypothetical protein [Akkermansia sp.]
MIPSIPVPSRRRFNLTINSGQVKLCRRLNNLPRPFHLMAKLIFYTAFLFNLVWLLNTAVIVFCRLTGKKCLILGGENSPASTFIEISTGISTWSAVAVLACGLLYTIFSVFLFQKFE